LASPGHRSGNGIHCILLFLVGGPSQLDTWDPKPGAPSEVRSPFRPIRTNVPGIDLCEHFPLMSAHADRFAIVRSVHHEHEAIHETGQQLLQTGQLTGGALEYPHFGAVLSWLSGPTDRRLPPFFVLPGPIGETGVDTSHGQGAGFLGARHEPFCPSKAHIEAACAAARALDVSQEKPALRDRFGRNNFGRSCLQARRLAERGVRVTTVNMFETVFNKVTWDCHADGGALASDLGDYRDVLCPLFDRAYTALLDDLQDRGLLRNTLVLAMGEFGRTPRLNPRGGRDHWPGVWSILFAGGGVRGGQVVGSSDRLGGQPRDRPVSAADVMATVYHAMGIGPGTRLPGPDGQAVKVAVGQPIHDLF
jgi:uncharacterized protein (DUF1501 family)